MIWRRMIYSKQAAQSISPHWIEVIHGGELPQIACAAAEASRLLASNQQCINGTKKKRERCRGAARVVIVFVEVRPITSADCELGAEHGSDNQKQSEQFRRATAPPDFAEAQACFWKTRSNLRKQTL
jgi:hypothetical protein